MKVVIGEVIKNLRKEKGISQETLAGKMGVSIQAVSKWECESSFPDIILIPQIAEYFGVSIDRLFHGESISEVINTIPDDDVLRIVQYKGKHILSKETYNPAVRIMLKINEDDYMGDNKPLIHVDVWGSADIQGNVSGGVEAGDGVNCGNVSGGVEAGDGVNCGNVSGGVEAGDGVNCGNVSGDVSAGDLIYCGDIDGNIINCSGDIHCNSISGDVHCDGNVVYETK